MCSAAIALAVSSGSQRWMYSHSAPDSSDARIGAGSRPSRMPSSCAATALSGIRDGSAYRDRSWTVVARIAPLRSRMTPRCAATTRSLRTWSVARSRSMARPKVCQYASRPASTSDEAANSAKSRRRRPGRTVGTLPSLARGVWLALRDERLSGDQRDVARVDHAEALSVGGDAGRRVEPRALDVQQRDLAPELVTLGRELLDVVTGDRERRALRHVDDREREGEGDRGDREAEDPQIPRRSSC